MTLKKQLIKIGFEVRENLAQLINGLIVGGILAGVAFVLFQKYPKQTAYTALGILIVYEILYYILPKKKKRCPSL